MSFNAMYSVMPAAGCAVGTRRLGRVSTEKVALELQVGIGVGNGARFWTISTPAVRAVKHS